MHEEGEKGWQELEKAGSQQMANQPGPCDFLAQGRSEKAHRYGSCYERGLEEDVVGLYQGKDEGQGIGSEQTLKLLFERQI